MNIKQINENVPSSKFIEGLVSVIIPAYNHQAYIEYCLDSILCNDYINLEIIIIDDGSSDLTFEIAFAWSLKNKLSFFRIHVEKQANMGLSRTLNRLVSLCRGEYIALLASDDALTRDSIQSRVDALKISGKRVVIGNCYLVDEKSNITSSDAISKLYAGSISALLNSRRLPGEIILRWSIPGPVMMTHRSIYDEKKVYEKYNPDLIIEDRYWYLDVISRNELTFLNKPIAFYRLHSDNTNNKLGNVRIIKDIIKSEKAMLSQFYGFRKFLLYIIYKKNLYTLKTIEEPSYLNRSSLIFVKMLAKIALFINRNL